MGNVFIKTYGCQANVADSSHIAKYLCNLGCRIVPTEAEADIIIVNTCAIRKKAEDKMFSYLGSIAVHKEKNPGMFVAVIGCVASYRKDEIKRRFPFVDFVFKARDDIAIFKGFMADVVEKTSAKKNLYGAVPQEGFRRSMINIMRGCNNYCSYCIVPFTTGRERSFLLDDIVAQVARDVQAGAKEVTLLGQNVNSYKDPKTGAGFDVLLENVAQIDGDFWVRFVSPHPKDMTSQVLRVMAAHNKLCSYIHLPLQSGSNKILTSMCRTYTVERYMELVDEIVTTLPHATMTTDIIVGFPGETEEDYAKTREAMEKVKFHTIFSFVYSPRKYTKAAEMVDDCPMHVKQARLQALQARQREIGTAVNQRLVGKKVKVLLEEKSADGYYVGRNEGNVRVFVKDCADIPVNTFVDVVIESARLSDVKGRLI